MAHWNKFMEKALSKEGRLNEGKIKEIPEKIKQKILKENEEVEKKIDELIGKYQEFLKTLKKYGRSDREADIILNDVYDNNYQLGGYIKMMSSDDWD